MGVGLTILICVDAALAAVGLYLHTRGTSVRDIPVRTALLACCAAAFVHFLAVGALGAYMVREEGAAGATTRAVMTFGGTASGAVPALIYAVLVVRAVLGAAGGFLYGSSQKTPPKLLYEARALAAKGDLDGALRRYRRVAVECPEDPEPLVASEGILETAHRYDEAARVCRELMDKFGHDPGVWTQAVRRLIHLNRGPLGRPDEAQRLEAALAERASTTKPPRRPRDAPSVQRMTAARRSESRKDVDGAVEKYRKQFAQRPDAPRPLFEAATALELGRRHEDAGDVLREIIRLFRDDDRTWAEAAYRLANLSENHLDDPETATYLLREIVKRTTPRSDVGRQARARLDRS